MNKKTHELKKVKKHGTKRVHTTPLPVQSKECILKSVLLTPIKAIESHLSEPTFDINNFVAAVYRQNGQVYIGEVIDMDEQDVYISFLDHRGGLSSLSTFAKPKKPDEVWVNRNDILCVTPEPSAGYGGKRHRLVLDKDVLNAVIHFHAQWKP